MLNSYKSKNLENLDTNCLRMFVLTHLSTIFSEEFFVKRIYNYISVSDLLTFK